MNFCDGTVCDPRNFEGVKTSKGSDVLEMLSGAVKLIKNEPYIVQSQVVGIAAKTQDMKLRLELVKILANFRAQGKVI